MNTQSLTQVIERLQHNMPMIGSSKAKEMATYRTIYNFAKECVSNYATFEDSQYYLYVQDLPDFVRQEFASLLMSNDESLAREAVGPDNEMWDSKMLPALIRYLKDTTDRDEEIEFTNTWRDCVTSYCEFKMEQLIDDALSDYNSRDRYDD